MIITILYYAVYICIFISAVAIYSWTSLILRSKYPMIFDAHSLLSLLTFPGVFAPPFMIFIVIAFLISTVSVLYSYTAFFLSNIKLIPPALLKLQTLSLIASILSLVGLFIITRFYLWE